MQNTPQILIVDDDANLRKTLIDILELKGFTALGAGSGQAALELYKKESFPVALVDLRLSDMPGLDVLKIIKENHPDTECIILTGFASTESAIQAINLGAYSYLQKPYDVNQLTLTIQRALEKKAASRALSESEKRYRQLYEGAIDGIIAIDLEGNIIDFNTSFLNLLQYSEEELRKKTVWDITPKKWHKENKRVHAQILERGYSDLFEKEYIREDGISTPVEISGFISRDNQNNPNGMWAFARDISERKKTEETLRRQLQEVTALHGIASAGTESNSIDELIKRTTNILQKTLYTDNFGILIYSKHTNTLLPHPSYFGLEGLYINREIDIKNGITGRTVRTKKPQLVPDVKKDRDYLESSPETQSELTVPILVKGDIFGIINSESSKLNFYSEADKRLLITLANQLSTAIEKINLFQAEQEHIKEITALYDTALATSSVLETETLYQRLYKGIKSLFPMNIFSVVRYDPQIETVEVDFLVENDKLLNEWIGRKFDQDENCLIGSIIRKQKPFMTNDLQKGKNLPPNLIHGEKPSRAWLGVPLTTRGYVIGGVSIQSFTPNVFTSNHQRLLESIAAQAAIALDNARLLEQTHSQIERLAALHDIDLVINSSLDLRVTLTYCLTRLLKSSELMQPQFYF